MNDSMMTKTYSEPSPPTISSSQPEAAGKTPDDKRHTIRLHIAERLVEPIPAIPQSQVMSETGVNSFNSHKGTAMINVGISTRNKQHN